MGAESEGKGRPGIPGSSDSAESQRLDERNKSLPLWSDRRQSDSRLANSWVACKKSGVRLAKHWPSRLSEVAQPEKETTSSARHHALITCMSVPKRKTSASLLPNRRTLHLG